MQRVFLNPQQTPSGISVTFRPDADNLIDRLMSNLANSKANQLDGKISDALRNTLFGRPAGDNPMGGQDLVGRNIFRSREVNLPTYAGLAECFGITPDAQVCPPTPPPACMQCSTRSLPLVPAHAFGMVHMHALIPYRGFWCSNAWAACIASNSWPGCAVRILQSLTDHII